MQGFIKPPQKIPFFIKVGIKFAKKVTGKDLLVPKLLSWYPKAAFSSGVLEAMTAHGKGDLDERILKLVRMQASLLISCAFCIDMNFYQYEKLGISEEAVKVLQNQSGFESNHGLSKREQLAIRYTRLMCRTPGAVTAAFMQQLKQSFTEREIVILATTIAQVNYWARLNQALGIPPAGFSGNCPVPNNHVE